MPEPVRLELENLLGLAEVLQAAAEHAGVHLVAGSAQQRRRAFDVGEEEGERRARRLTLSVGARRAIWRAPVKLWLLQQNGLFEGTELWGRVDAQLLAQLCPQPLKSP